MHPGPRSTVQPAKPIWGLGRDLTAEDTLALLVGLGAPEDVHLDLLEVEQAH